MNTEHDKQRNLVDATDCLEAIGVFKAWKNFFFLITLLSLLLIQVCFWAAHLHLVKDSSPQEEIDINISVEQAGDGVITLSQTVEVPAEIQQAASEVVADVNTPVVEKHTRKPVDVTKIIKPVHIAWTIRSAGVVIIFSAMLYCLTILFCLKISLVGRLGGINHISRAFFISLILLVFLMPWQECFGWFLAGAVFAPSELTAALKNYPDMLLIEQAWFYLRFVGFWVLILLLLLFAQARTSRWARATLKRLEVI